MVVVKRYAWVNGLNRDTVNRSTYICHYFLLKVKSNFMFQTVDTKLDGYIEEYKARSMSYVQKLTQNW